MSPVIFNLRQYVENFLVTEDAITLNNREINEKLKELRFEENRIRDEDTARVDRWCDGACLADIGEILAIKFSQLLLPEFEDEAVTIWVIATLSVCAHYHHLVGPAMIALANMHKRRGDLDSAKGCFESIVLDFEPELKRAEKGGLWDADHVVSIESLALALSELLEMENKTNKKNKYEKLLKRMNLVLSSVDK